jgi:glycosyltransferase involved in cell wall biosynthesis
MMLDVFNRLDAITTPSHAAVNILKQQDIHPPVYAVSNGVERDRFFPDPQIDSASIRRRYNLRADQPLFLYVGRLDGEKSVDLILNAISKIQRKDFQFAVVGHGKERQALTDQIHRLGLEGRVRILGYIPSKELPPLYLAADVFVMPSPAELQSIATLEALACGKPVLAANARALPELVTHEVNGYLFQPGNIADAAHWMNEFLAHPEQWEIMGKESLKQAQRHGIDKTVQAYEQVYQQAMELKQQNTEVEKPTSVHNSIFDVFRSGKVFKR